MPCVMRRWLSRTSSVIDQYVPRSAFVSFGILFALRIRAEERMMLETFGEEYASYMARTKRLVPGVW